MSCHSSNSEGFYEDGGCGSDEQKEVTLPKPRLHRGKHTRTAAMGKRGKWLTHVQAHMKEVRSGTLLGKAACSLSCTHKACNELVDLRVAKLCAEESFGTAVTTDDWPRIRRNHQAVKNWFRLAFESRVLDPDKKVVTQVNYRLNGISVCLGVWAAFHGILPATAAAIHRQVMHNEEVWSTGLAKQDMLAKRRERAHLTNAAAAWWYIRLGYYEVVVDFGYIQCPRDICWIMVYEDEFVPEMKALGYHWKEDRPQLDNRGNKDALEQDFNEASEAESVDINKDGTHVERGSISTWYRGKHMALQRWAHEKIGPNAKAFKLVSRAKHSAYVSHASCEHRPHSQRRHMRMLVVASQHISI